MLNVCIAAKGEPYEIAEEKDKHIVFPGIDGFVGEAIEEDIEEGVHKGVAEQAGEVGGAGTPDRVVQNTLEGNGGEIYTGGHKKGVLRTVFKQPLKAADDCKEEAEYAYEQGQCAEPYSWRPGEGGEGQGWPVELVAPGVLLRIEVGKPLMSSVVLVPYEECCAEEERYEIGDQILVQAFVPEPAGGRCEAHGEKSRSHKNYGDPGEGEQEQGDPYGPPAVCTNAI